MEHGNGQTIGVESRHQHILFLGKDPVGIIHGVAVTGEAETAVGLSGVKDPFAVNLFDGNEIRFVPADGGEKLPSVGHDPRGVVLHMKPQIQAAKGRFALTAGAAGHHHFRAGFPPAGQ